MFRNRNDAGIKLYSSLSGISMRDPVVYAIPRGGVIVGYEVAVRLNAPLAMVIVKKIGHPYEPEYAIGAMSEGEPEIVVHGRDFENAQGLDEFVESTRKELRDRARKYRKGMPLVSCRGRTAIVVDDGIATGLTARAALLAVRNLGPSELILATPVVDRIVETELEPFCDRIVAVERVRYLQAVGSYYLEFPQVDDETVMLYMGAAEKRSDAPAGR